MEPRCQHKAENNHHKGTFLYKGKSDSLILRWPSLDKHLQADALAAQRVTNRKYAGASRQNYTHPVHHDSSFDGGEFPTSDLLDNSMLSKTSSTASLSLGIAGPLIFPSDHMLATIADGSKSKEEEADSDETLEVASCVKGKPSIVAPTNESVSISIDRHNDNNMALLPPPPIALKFVDVTYQVSNKDGKDNELLQSWLWRMQAKLGMKRQEERDESRRRKKKREKRIVKGIAGHVKAGEVLALMGPSGSGKTTLLNILSGRVMNTEGQQKQQRQTISQPHLPYCESAGDRQQHGGSITYNGMPYSKALKSRIGFVMQDDVLYPHLTVKETLVYAALLRLPNTLPKKDRIERAMEVVYELGLERCQHTIIGGAFLRGVSGGERKRVCIGQEVLIDPSLLFLDEPTSGLDSTTALRIVQMLRKISRVGRTVVTTIHQPSSRIFHMFDKLILLSAGHMLYFGKASATMDYFSSIGFSPQITMNPADFLLDLASGNVVDMSLPSKMMDQCEGRSCISFDDTKGNGSSNIGSIHSTRPLAKEVRKYLVEAYESQKHALLEDLLHGKKSSSHDKHIVGKHGLQWSEQQEWSTTWLSQFCVLYMRGLRERRHEYLSSLRVLQVFASAVVIGCLWWHSNTQTQRQLADQVGLLFFIATYWGFFPLFTALFTFPLERAILAKERASNMYRLSAYFMARTLGDIPLDFCLPLLFHIIVYFMAHLRPTTSAFFLSFMIVLLSTIAAQGMGMAIGAIFMDLKKATTLASVVLLTFMLSGGFFVQAIPSFISWIKYVSYNYYTFKLLASLQYDAGQEYGCHTPTGCQKIENSTIFHNISLEGGADEVVILLAMIVGYRLIAYLALRYTRQII